MFPKPKYKDSLASLTTFITLVAFSPYAITLLLNISSEKVNPLLCHIVFGKTFLYSDLFEMYLEMNCVFKVNNRTTEIGVKYIQS